MAAIAFQLSAEKALKAAVRAGIGSSPRTHDLGELLALLDSSLPAQHPVLEAALEINAMTPARRYPGDLPEPTVEEARSLRDAAAIILEFARELLNPPA